MGSDVQIAKEWSTVPPTEVSYNKVYLYLVFDVLQFCTLKYIQFLRNN